MQETEKQSLIEKIEALQENIYYVDGLPHLSSTAHAVNEKLKQALEIIRSQPTSGDVEVMYLFKQFVAEKYNYKENEGLYDAIKVLEQALTAHQSNPQGGEKSNGKK
jgi:hypothetical protein